MRVAFLGTGDFGVPALRALKQQGHEIVVAISQPDRPAGRGRVVRPTPIHAAADELNVRHLQAEDVNALDTADALAGAQLGVVAAFGQKIGRQILDALPLGCVNIHGSLLPKYRGAAPFQRAIIDCADETGVTIFQLNERWDAGEIWSQRATPISDAETAEELHDRLAEIGAELLIETLAKIAAGQTRPMKQDEALASRAPKLSKADGTVDWTQAARRIVRRIHGLWPWPAAACQFHSRAGKEERVMIARAEVAGDAAVPSKEFPPGNVCEDGTVQAGVGRVRLLEVRPAGGKLMSFEAFAHGRHVGAGDRLDPVQM